AKIQAGMARYGSPGVAVGVLAHGREYVQGYGVTNVDYPAPVDGDTLFRIGSTTKTVTGTTVMRLVEQGTLDLDATVRTYLPDFQTADPSVAARVTLRPLLNHSARWRGADFEDTGRGARARVRGGEAPAAAAPAARHGVPLHQRRRGAGRPRARGGHRLDL